MMIVDLRLAPAALDSAECFCEFAPGQIDREYAPLSGYVAHAQDTMIDLDAAPADR
jgi:hypothetical protein